MNRCKSMIVSLAVATSVAATPALADTLQKTGDTTGQPTFASPNDNGNAPSTSTGPQVQYQAGRFTVSQTGSYTITTTTQGNYDGYLSVYENSFDPNDPLANNLATNDDFGSMNVSQLTLNLNPSTDYFFVQNGSGPSDFGAYTATISGIGQVVDGGFVSAAPEPASWALMLLGFGIAGGALRRGTRRGEPAFA